MDLDDRFFKYHKENPHVYKLFAKYAKQVKSLGYGSYSMRTIMHRVRWHINIETKDRDGFKMNNSYSSRYARLLIEKMPRFKTFFELRRLQSPSALAIKGIDY